MLVMNPCPKWFAIADYWRRDEKKVRIDAGHSEEPERCQPDRDRDGNDEDEGDREECPLPGRSGFFAMKRWLSRP